MVVIFLSCFGLLLTPHFLRTHFRPFTDVPSENFEPRYKENGGNTPCFDHGLAQISWPTVEAARSAA
jgi:hypothetical protein